MDAGQVALIVFQTILSIFVGVVGWSIRNTLGTIRDNIKKNAEDIEKLDEKQTKAVEKVQTELHNLKSDLPFVYVTREDYIRTMNNVDKQMTTIDSKLDRLLSKGYREE